MFTYKLNMSYSIQELSDYLRQIDEEKNRLLREAAEQLSLKTVIEAIEGNKSGLDRIVYNANSQLEPGQPIELRDAPFDYILSPEEIELKYDGRTLRTFTNPSVSRFYRKISKRLADLIDEEIRNLPF